MKKIRDEGQRAIEKRDGGVKEGHLSVHTYTSVSTVRPGPTVAKVAMATSHQNGNYN